jgi:tRNA(Arg) A34 adenosine deaminase TadA
MNHDQFMRKVLEVSNKSIESGSSPFAAIIVKDGEIVSEGYNRVVLDNDPSAHAEIVAIRAACKKLNHFHLTGCTLYTTNEPCPMCRSAIRWAKLDQIVYVKPVKFASTFGFLEDIEKGDEARLIQLESKIDQEVENQFHKWKNNPKHKMY